MQKTMFLVITPITAQNPIPKIIGLYKTKDAAFQAAYKETGKDDCWKNIVEMPVKG